MNDRLIEAVLKDAKAWCPKSAEPHLISPSRRDFLRVPGDMTSMSQTAEWLPLVSCVARFRGISPARDSSKDFSSLVVVWFQDEFALPLAETILSSLTHLDWNALAADEVW
jgi:hypothetical protein